MTLEEKLNELRNEINKSSTRTWTDEDVKSACVSIIHDGVLNKGWNINMKNSNQS